MSVPSALVLFSVIWVVVMFVVLPIGMRTQEDEQDIVPGTHPGSPANFRLKRTLVIVTVVSVVVFAIIAGVIVSGVIRLSELGWV